MSETWSRDDSTKGIIVEDHNLEVVMVRGDSDAVTVRLQETVVDNIARLPGVVVPRVIEYDVRITRAMLASLLEAVEADE